AGGAWSSLFLGRHGLALPQWKILASVLRTAPAADGPDLAAGGAGFGFRKRLDGGYTIANLGGEVADIVPDTLRFLPDFAATALAHWRRTRPRLGGRSWREARLPRHWALDAPSPFEAVRVLDPKPHLPGLRAAQKALADAVPFFRNVRPVQGWGGMIDVTPDLIPVMSAVEQVHGLFVATGFSGHGFGLGPGAGQLMADLVAGDTPVVDPAAFRFSRFAERPRPRPSATAL
ncbi:FAD-binding oxidoreductase, partial [Roseomonas sp. KE0001]|uniref:NAD(P)/FAD-dependent oxidoreductase n=1 Tax=Roseomonas sp. KE0001 TaxID=2479201 RepID=UPI0018E00CD9